MLASRLARRIVLPLLGLVGVLFFLLGFAALASANRSVDEELEETADRVARTLDLLPGGGARVPVAPARPPDILPPILPAIAQLAGVELIVEGAATGAWDEAERDAVEAGVATLGGRSYRVLERRSQHRPGRILVLFDEARIARRRGEVLWPIAVAGAVGLLAAAVFGFVVARTITAPLKALADRAGDFAAGRAPAAAGPRGPGELGELQASFDTMVAAIREGEEKLRENERFAALGRLAGGIAHELRNPLTAVRMAVEMATSSGSEMARVDARRVALSEIDRLDRTLREMLDYVRPRQPERVSFPALKLIDDVESLLGPQCNHLRVRLETEAPDDLLFDADYDRIKQALLNLVINAAQAQPHGGVVRVRASADVFEVEDDGPGIDESVRDRLTEPFVTTKEAGIGLGLAVVRQVAEEHGGALDFRTGEGGTTFILRIPPAS